jgi:two-component system chemotaxis response regulator CheB
MMNSMNKIKVLVVDDSAVIRKILSEILKEDPELDVVGMASSGKTALQQIDYLKPDVVTLDIAMPEMDGLETLRHIRSKDTRLPVIMFSSLTEEGAVATMEALDLGANDFIAKPSARGQTSQTGDRIRNELRERIKALARAHGSSAGATSQRVLTAQRRTSSKPAEVKAIGIAISTGGPNALVELVGALSPDLAIPIFITQHMPPFFTRILADRLSSRGNLEVVEAQHGHRVEPGRVYIAPGDFHLEVACEGEQLFSVLSQAAPENSCRPSADVMFRSLARIYGPNLLTLVMTGMGADGQKGCEVVKRCGGIVLAQDEASSTVWGMPGAVVSAGLADEILPLDRLGHAINSRCNLEVVAS